MNRVERKPSNYLSHGEDVRLQRTVKCTVITQLAEIPGLVQKMVLLFSRSAKLLTFEALNAPAETAVSRGGPTELLRPVRCKRLCVPSRIHIVYEFFHSNDMSCIMRAAAELARATRAR